MPSTDLVLCVMMEIEEVSVESHSDSNSPCNPIARYHIISIIPRTRSVPPYLVKS
jgi:hypothetical protein